MGRMFVEEDVTTVLAGTVTTATVNRVVTTSTKLVPALVPDYLAQPAKRTLRPQRMLATGAELHGACAL